MQPPALAQRARNALKLKWNTPEDPGGVYELTYVLQVSPAPLGMEDQPTHMGFVEVYRGTERSFKVAKLQPGVRYTSRVQAINPLGEGPFSLCSAYTTQATVPTAPEAPMLQTASSSSITLAWPAPADNGSPIIGYCLERDDGAGGDFGICYNGPNTSHTIKDLRPGCQYRFRLRADNDEGKSLWSATAAYGTGASPPGSPASLQVMSAGRVNATISWRGPEDDGGGKLVAFEVELQAKSRAATACMGHDWLKIFEGLANACTINSLRPGCAYRVRVRARNEAGWGQWAIPADLTTAADVPEAPTALQPASSSASAIVITWAAPRHDGGTRVARYRMEMAPGECGCGMCPHAAQAGPGGQAWAPALCPAHAPLPVYDGETVGAELRHLQPACRYIFRVQAVNAQGAGPWTDWVGGVTTADVPVVPAPPGVVGVAATQLVLAWQAPPCQGASITCYTVESAPLPGSMLGAPGSAGILADPRVAASLPFRQAYRGPHTTCEVRGLEPYAAYAFRLSAHNDMGCSGWSVCSAAVTGHAPPTGPQLLCAEPASCSQVVIRWAPPERDYGAPVQSYTVEYAPAAAAGGAAGAKGAGGKQPAVAPAAPWVQIYEGPVLSCAAEGLLPGRSYQFRVRATNAMGRGPFCAPVAATTLPAPPSAPGRPALLGRTANGLRVRWDDPHVTNGSAVNLHVLEMCVAGGSEWAEVYRGSEAQAKLGGLQPATKYLLRAAAGNAAGMGPWGECEAHTTMLLPPQPPAQLRVVEVVEPLSRQQQLAAGGPGADAAGCDTAAVCVAWEEPAATATTAGVCGYEATATPKPGCEAASLPGGGVLKTVLPASKTDARLEGLQLGCQYSVRLRAIGLDGTGHSAWSEEVVVVTPPKPDVETLSMSSVAVGAAGGGAAAGGAAAQQRKAGRKGGKQRTPGVSSSGAIVVAGARSSDDGAASGHAASGAGGGKAPKAPKQRVAAVVSTVAAKKMRKVALWEVVCEKLFTDALMQYVVGAEWRRSIPSTLRRAYTPVLGTITVVLLAWFSILAITHYAATSPLRHH